MFPKCFFRASNFKNIVPPAVLEVMFDVGNSITSSTESSSQPLLLCVAANASGTVGLSTPALISIAFTGEGGERWSLIQLAELPESNDFIFQELLILTTLTQFCLMAVHYQHVWKLTLWMMTYWRVLRI